MGEKISEMLLRSFYALLLFGAPVVLLLLWVNHETEVVSPAYHLWVLRVAVAAMLVVGLVTHRALRRV